MSSNENNTPDPLDAILREQDAYVPDNGFTARVITSLPRRRHRAWLRPAILSGAMIAGSFIAIASLPHPIETLRNAFDGVLGLNLGAALPLLPLIAALVPIFWSSFEILREES